MSTKSTDRFSELAARWLAGDEDETVSAQLLALCQSDPAHLAELAALTSVDRLLPLLEEADVLFAEEVRCRLSTGRDGASFTASVSERIKPAKQPISFLPWAIIAAVAAIVVIFAIPKPETTPEIAVASAPIATITTAVAVTWESGFAPKKTDVALGEYRLVSGLASLEFQSGVTMIVEAPAQFSIESEERVVLKTGTVTANVPDGAEGFTVDTDTTRIIDRGTEFAVSASPTGETEVHVLQGIVDTHPISDQSHMMRLTENQARAFSRIGNGSAFMEADPSRFYRELPTGQLKDYRWLHWSFDEGEGTQAVATDHGLGGGDMAAVFDSIDEDKPGPSWIPGAVGSAISFSGGGDYLKTDYMGIAGTGARTVAFWVRIPRDWKPVNGYGMIGWGSYRYKGATWQISANPAKKEGPIGHLRIGTNRAQVIGSRDLRDGKWHHVAVVMYGGEGANTATHIIAFIDGQIDPANRKSVHAIDTDVSPDLPMLMGRSASRTTKGNRCFHGDMDEVYIFDSALSQDEILKLMHNQPIIP